MLKLHLKRHTRLLTPARRNVADIYQQHQPRNNYHLQKQKQQKHLNIVSTDKCLWDLNRVLQFNQTFDQRIVFNLELYHKNILKKFHQTFYKKSKHQYQFIKIP